MPDIPDRVDDVLDFLSNWDWISPVVAGVQDIANGPNYTFLIDRYTCHWSPDEIASHLRRHGIGTWGHMIVCNEIMITVRQHHAARAHQLLMNEGLPLLTGSPDGAGPVQQAPDHYGDQQAQPGWQPTAPPQGEQKPRSGWDKFKGLMLGDWEDE